MSNVRTLKRRRLSDLFVTGTEVTLDDGQGDPITVWVSKISPMERRLAVDEAARPRAKTLSLKKLDNDAAEKLRFIDQIEELFGQSRESVIEFLMGPKLYELEISAQERIAAEDKWADKDYLAGLQKAWQDEMYDRYMENEEDEEAARVFKELKLYTDEVDASIADDREALHATYEDTPDEDLRSKALNQLIDTEADFVWMNELRRQELFYAVRDSTNHRERYFEDRAEVDHIDEHVFSQLLSAYLEVSVDSVEGKGSEETPSS